MCYFSNALAYPSATVDAICHALNDSKFNRVDFVVGMGISGTLVLLPVSIQSKIPFGVIRKTIDLSTPSYKGGSHSPREVETSTPSSHQISRYVTIDDLIETGDTIRQILRIMTNKYTHSKCVGIILYQNQKRHETETHWDGIPLTCLYNDILNLDAMQRANNLRPARVIENERLCNEHKNTNKY